jgi:hypothetical protein
MSSNQFKHPEDTILTFNITIEEIDLTNDVVALENVSIRDLENELYAMVEVAKRRRATKVILLSLRRIPTGIHLPYSLFFFCSSL